MITDDLINLENARLTEYLSRLTERQICLRGLGRVLIPIVKPGWTTPRDRCRWCARCRVYDYNREHLCTFYDGPPCKTCGEPTLFYMVGAPGYGSGLECRNGHDEHLTRHGIYTPEEVR